MVKPKKHLGQHFLTEPAVAQRIVDALSYDNKVNILEIGPGKGVLTKFLLQKETKEVKVVELDDESVHYLNNEYPSLQVINDDFLKLNLTELFDQKKFSLIGNFPYNISSQIVFKVLENRYLIPQMVGMFQREVARRICAEPGNKDYGILSVLCQSTYHTEYLFTVNEGVFFPPPKVKSGVLRMNYKSEQLSDEKFKALWKMVKLAFNQRRKQLKNSLSSMLPKDFEHDLLTKRPEQLHYSEFLVLLEDIGEH